MQFQVPQFIETEDKIVGPFTIRQFIYVAFAGGFSFMLYFTIQTWLWFAISVFLFSFAMALAFIKVGGRPMSHVLTAAFNFYWKPQTYVWQPEHPEIQKSAESLQPMEKSGTAIEDIISGKSLRNVWQNLQTGTKISDQQFFGEMENRYQVFQRLSGERDAARRIDYR